MILGSSFEARMSIFHFNQLQNFVELNPAIQHKPILGSEKKFDSKCYYECTHTDADRQMSKQQKEENAFHGVC